jgi:hypothetical protein
LPHLAHALDLAHQKGWQHCARQLPSASLGDKLPTFATRQNDFCAAKNLSLMMLQRQHDAAAITHEQACRNLAN